MRSIKLIIVLLFTLCLVGCGSKEEEHEHEFRKGICECGEIKEGYYEITFKTDGGSKVKKQIVKKGNLVTKPNNPTKEGYTFFGWYYNNELYNFNTEVSKDITLNAKWVILDSVKPAIFTEGTNVEVYANVGNTDQCSFNIPLGGDNLIGPGTSGKIELNLYNVDSYQIEAKLDYEFDYDVFEFSYHEDFSNFRNDINDLGIVTVYLEANSSPGTFTIYWRLPFNSADSSLGETIITDNLILTVNLEIVSRSEAR